MRCDTNAYLDRLEHEKFLAAGRMYELTLGSTTLFGIFTGEYAGNVPVFDLSDGRRVWIDNTWDIMEYEA